MIREIGEPEPREPLMLKVITDPATIDQLRRSSDQFRKNSAWLQSHWGDLLPGAYGKHLAVAGQEAFLSDSMEESLEWARTAHPDDRGFIIQYVLPPTGARVYALRG